MTSPTTHSDMNETTRREVAELLSPSSIRGPEDVGKAAEPFA